MNLNKEFWENRYENKDTGWDIGYISTPLKTYIDQLENKNIKILIPGAGKGYEPIYLHEQGFKNVFVVDIAEQPLDHIKKVAPTFPVEHLIQEDFFNLKLNGFDLILEQTFFCALSPEFRPNYAIKMHSLLANKGKLAGLLFNFPKTEKGPPFGGNIEEYITLFQDLFTIKTLEKASNSILPRAGKELFFIFEK
ncbi:thiopurine S-methyltransferase [Maribacter vaceletii]|uniref:Thiopurine S-methyltransferase n=1 Tax=Maribacter vaceletii TaxID=1206816 RepID=A0A495E5G5_9FLAO|nr:methyltransferase domain-containing protein [Maribacter vaceletii]RKR12150.1 thiopurine S-methyltransferase [Maribacter vaceletii]